MTTTTSSTAAPTTAGTGAAIVSTLGSGSGIDSNSIVTQLTAISKLPESNRLTTKQTLLESQISDFGLLRSAFSKLESAAALLSNPDTFNAKSTSIPTTNLIGITKLDAKASVGDYSIKVKTLAQSQSLSSGNFSSQTASIGKGSIAIRFGTWTNVDDNAVPPVLKDFTVDATKTGATITVDDSNNSLIGLRDSINKSGIGVKASIVSNGGVFKLLVTAPSGASSEVEMTATETPGSEGLASFTVNQTTRNMTQQQDGRDSVVSVNGMDLTRSTNHLTDVVEGLEFDLYNTSSTETINLGITADKSISEKAIRDFVASYNTFLSDSNKLVGLDTEKNTYGSLHTDPLAKNLIQQVRSQLNSSVTGLSTGFTNLSTLGIRTELSGTLAIDDSKESTSFRSSIDNNFDAVRDLFIPKTSSTNAQITVTKNSAQSVPGSYDVVISQQPAKGSLLGGEITAFNTGLNTLDTTGQSYKFKVAVDGTTSTEITLPDKVYASGAELAADLQARINAETNIAAAKVGLSITYNTTSHKLEFTSTAFGSSSNVVFSGLSAPMADMGIDVAHSTGTAGSDVAGTVGGVAAFGFGNVLLPALGSKAEGLSMRVEAGATSGTITFSRGFSGTFTNLIDDFLKSSGMIKKRETNIDTQVKKVKTDLKNLDRRSEAYRARLQAQFSAMEGIVSSLKKTGTFLTSAFKSLSGTSDN